MHILLQSTDCLAPDYVRMSGYAFEIICAVLVHGCYVLVISDNHSTSESSAVEFLRIALRRIMSGCQDALSRPSMCVAGSTMDYVVPDRYVCVVVMC